MGYKRDLPPEDAFYREAAQIIVADLEEDYLEDYALICASIRYQLKGLKPEFILESINELRQAIKIEIE